MKKDKFINGYNVTNPKIQSEKVLVHLLKNKSITSFKKVSGILVVSKIYKNNIIFHLAPIL